jgi:hypothetical protein
MIAGQVKREVILQPASSTARRAAAAQRTAAGPEALRRGTEGIYHESRPSNVSESWRWPCLKFLDVPCLLDAVAAAGCRLLVRLGY